MPRPALLSKELFTRTEDQKREYRLMAARVDNDRKYHGIGGLARENKVHEILFNRFVAQIHQDIADRINEAHGLQPQLVSPEEAVVMPDFMSHKKAYLGELAVIDAALSGREFVRGGAA